MRGLLEKLSLKGKFVLGGIDWGFRSANEIFMKTSQFSDGYYLVWCWRMTYVLDSTFITPFNYRVHIRIKNY